MIAPLVDRAALDAALDARGRARLAELEAEVAADPSRLGRVFPAVGRQVGRGTVTDAGRQLPVPDAARVALLAAAEATAGPALVDAVRGLYRFGDADEKRAVLHALNGWTEAAAGEAPAGQRVDASDLVSDALRTNDTRLVEAAVGAGAHTLDQPAWRHAVLKCLFTGVPVAAVADLAARADLELGAMTRRYAREREAAGRAVPDDVPVVLAACPDPAVPDERQ